MDTKKRRVIYMADDEWAWVGDYAREMHMTISAVIRQVLEESGVGLRPDEPIPAETLERENVFAGVYERFDTQPVRAVPKVTPRAKNPR